MATLIKFHHWDGGSGFNDRTSVVGYVKEEPKEVLSRLLKSNSIYEYEGLYRPIDPHYPNNAYGYVIIHCDEEELKNSVKGLSTIITGKLDDFQFKDGKLKEDRKIEDIVNYLEDRKNEDYEQMLEDVDFNRNHHFLEDRIKTTKELIEFIASYDES